MNLLTQLTKQQQLFVSSYAGDIIEAMQVAGYEGDPAKLELKGKKLLSDPLIIEAIKNRTIYHRTQERAIATREERQEFWTSIMKNHDPHAKEVPDTVMDPKTGISMPNPDKDRDIPLAMRIKATELLGKSEADFVDKVDMTTNLTISDVIKESYTIENESNAALDDLEQQAMQRIQKAKKERGQIESDAELGLEDLI